VKKILTYLLALVLLYSLFRELNVIKASLIVLALGTIYLVYRLPGRSIVAMKYPVILLSFAATAGFFFYPALTLQEPLVALITFLSLYATIFYLTTIDEKEKNVFKEITALSILFLSGAFNLAMSGNPLVIVSFALAVMLFLFIMGRTRIIPFVAGYTLLVIVLLYRKEVHIIGPGMPIGDVHRCLLFASAFVLLAICFAGFVRQTTFAKLLSFFGLLYVAVDLLLGVGFKVVGGLLYQPVTALFVISPFIGAMLKSERERT
jgi:hypothetical protein